MSINDYSPRCKPLYMENEIDILKKEINNGKKMIIILKSEMSIIKNKSQIIINLLRDNESFKNKAIGFLFTIVIGLLVDKYWVDLLYFYK